MWAQCNHEDPYKGVKKVRGREDVTIKAELGMMPLLEESHESDTIGLGSENGKILNV